MLRTRPVVITGPTGWIGTALLAALARLGPGWDRHVRLFGSSQRQVTAPDGTALLMRALDTITADDVAGADVVHLAYLTKEKVELLGETAFFATNGAIDDALLSAIVVGRPHALFVASSGAAQLAERGDDRHLYGVMKLRQEDRFLAFGSQSDVPVIAGRIFNIAGPFINKLESYAVSSFLTQALGSGRIRIAATVPVFRSYLHVADLSQLVLRLLDEGAWFGRPIDFCGSELLEMADVAETVADVVGLARDAIERGPIDHRRPSAYVGNPVMMRSLAQQGGIALADFTRQVRDTLAFVRGADTTGASADVRRAPYVG